MARRATKITELRSENKNVLLVDAGRIPAPRGRSIEIDAEFIYKVMGDMGYDVVSLIGQDFVVDQEKLRAIFKDAPFPVITTNFVHKESGKPWAEQYVIKEIAGAKIAVLGLMASDTFAARINLDQPEEFIVLPPKEVLADMLPKMRKQADVVLVMTDIHADDLHEMTKDMDGPDIVVTQNTMLREDYRLENYERKRVTQYLPANPKAERLGFCKFDVLKDGIVSVEDKKKVRLDEGIPGDINVLNKIVEHDEIVKREIRNKRREELIEEKQKEYNDKKKSMKLFENEPDTPKAFSGQ